MDLKDILPILFERSNAMQTYWNFYIVVTLGIMGFFSTARSIANLIIVRLLFTVGFLGFAVVNLEGILWVVAQRQALANEVLKLITPNGPLASLKDPIALLGWEIDPTRISPPKMHSVAIFHVVGDGLVLGVIWLVPWLSRKKKVVRSPAS
jgi:hypothetical protein